MSDSYDPFIPELLNDEYVGSSIADLLHLAQRLTFTSISLLAFPWANKAFSLSSGHISEIYLEHNNSLLPGTPYLANVVPDTHSGTAHSGNQLVHNAPHLRSFACVPVLAKTKQVVAHMCVGRILPVTGGQPGLEDMTLLAAQLGRLWDSACQSLLLKISTQSATDSNVQRVVETQRKFYESILNNLPVDIAVFDTDHRYIFVNPGAVSDKALRSYIIGKDDFEYCRYRNRDVKIAEQRQVMFLDIKKTGRTIIWEDTMTNSAGDPITHLRRFFPVYDNKGELSMVIGFGIDITERKKMEDRQALLLKQISIRNNQLVDLFNIIVHNLRTPVGNIRMLIEMMTHTTDESEKNGLFEYLYPLLDNIGMTLDELMESIQISQDTEIETDINELDACLQKVLAGVQVSIVKSKATIDCDFSGAPVVKFPFKYLENILLNLVTNALKYQSPDRLLHLKIRSFKNNGEIILSVADNGLGIDLKKHGDNIFKIGKTFHKHPEAKGFGLFMLKTQVEAMNGEIWVESYQGVGSTFFVKFVAQS